MKSKKRKVDIVVISDVHLGTYGCHAKELSRYLKSIKPKILILNGDIIDAWQFSKRYWPKSHMKVVREILGMSAKGVKIYYITGNHDEFLRKFTDLSLGNLEVLNKLELTIDGKKAWFFHGDVFDVVMQYSKWLARLGSISYDALIFVNIIVNRISEWLGRSKVSLSKAVKDNVKGALKYINDFEVVAANMAISKEFDYIICGHIHKPSIRKITHNNKDIIYLNSGDWIENLTALECYKGEWSIYKYLEDEEMISEEPEDEDVKNEADMNNKELFNKILEEFQS